MEYCEILSQLIAESGVRIRHLSAQTGISDSLLGSYAKGNSIPGLKNALDIADYFGVSLDYMTGRSEVREVQPTPIEAEKDPSPDISRNGSDMLAVFEQLPEREQAILLGEARGLLLAQSLQDAQTPPATQAG